MTFPGPFAVLGACAVVWTAAFVRQRRAERALRARQPLPQWAAQLARHPEFAEIVWLGISERVSKQRRYLQAMLVLIVGMLILEATVYLV